MTTAPLLPLHIKLNAKPTDKSTAILQVADLMEACKLTAPEYGASLLQREAVASTSLGHGIAIPHGMPAHRHLIRQTGVVILQIPEGLKWGDDTVHLVIGIAADTDAHLSLLQRLTRLLQPPSRLLSLFTTDRHEAFYELLGIQAPAHSPPSPQDDLPHRFEWRLAYPGGLHARPASEWAKTAHRFDAAIRVRRGNESADGRQIFELLRLGIMQGESLVVSAAGPEAESALQAMRITMLALCEPENRTAAPMPTIPPLDDRTSPDRIVSGAPASPGQVSAPTWRLRANQVDVADRPGTLQSESCRLELALGEALRSLTAQIEQSASRPDNNAQGILQAQRLMLDDRSLIAECCQLLAQGHGAAWSWQQTIENRARQLDASERPMVRARSADIRDIGRRVLDALGESMQTDWIAALPADRIVIADDLPPSEMARLLPGQVLGLCLAGSGPQAHTAILARALGLPCMVAAGATLLSVPDDTPAILDGARGELTLHPSSERTNHPRSVPSASDSAEVLPATLFANADTPEQWQRAREQGACGVGLMRSESLFLRAHDWLDEEAQCQAFRTMAKASVGHSLVIRLLDIGGDKAWPTLSLPEEDNPALGMRGVRLLLARPDLLEPHLRALYRAASHGPVSILIPMITSVEELLALREICEAVRLDLQAPPVPIGAMIEVPAAALLADSLAKHADFLSIGTNDLTQYALAMDRQHPRFAMDADARHPAVLRLIDRIAQAAQAHDCPLSVCGALAGQPGGAQLLCGLGIRSLSMVAAELPPVRAALRADSVDTLVERAKRALAADTLAAVRSLTEETG
ncbi:phosphoenolpyruvate--protein phosphotransferase [Paludibacterium purpuratum]|uniref:phosphoenolpyruvate--protein phosphotransferase n=1 Tax=Paludibacterium purpuratum TaxID=1144873 RepID=A0A4R7B560_9NEIS|nr:phosphoenolpyruvate--protein phosphotransferase [Paludibacterium purpuratum]TDR79800.1 phosphocarrier protein FPr [Paludibacterium purpuratum]